MLRPIPLALLALVLAAPARADAPPPERAGGLYREGFQHRPRHLVRGQFRRAPDRSRHRIARVRVDAPPVGPAYYAWPEPEETRVPIYNRPAHLPLLP